MGNYLKEEVIKLTGSYLQRKQELFVSFIVLLILLLLFNAEHQLCYFGKNVSKRYILVLEHIADYSAKDFTA